MKPEDRPHPGTGHILAIDHDDDTCPALTCAHTRACLRAIELDARIERTRARLDKLNAQAEAAWNETIALGQELRQRDPELQAKADAAIRELVR